MSKKAKKPNRVPADQVPARAKAASDRIADRFNRWTEVQSALHNNQATNTEVNVIGRQCASVGRLVIRGRTEVFYGHLAIGATLVCTGAVLSRVEQLTLKHKCQGSAAARSLRNNIANAERLFGTVWNDGVPVTCEMLKEDSTLRNKVSVGEALRAVAELGIENSTKLLKYLDGVGGTPVPAKGGDAVKKPKPEEGGQQTLVDVAERFVHQFASAPPEQQTRALGIIAPRIPAQVCKPQTDDELEAEIRCRLAQTSSEESQRIAGKLLPLLADKLDPQARIQEVYRLVAAIRQLPEPQYSMYRRMMEAALLTLAARDPVGKTATIGVDQAA